MARLRHSLIAVVGTALVVSGLATLPSPPAAAAPTGTITCAVSPGSPVLTMMNTPVSGAVTCTHSAGLPVAHAVAPYLADVRGPFAGKLTLDRATGAFTYSPGWYPPDENGRQERLPEYTGPDSFVVIATASDGATASTEVPIVIQPPPRSCNPDFTPTTRTLFNDPSGSEAKQYQMLRYLIQMIDCTPPVNPDGTQASIRFSFYSLTYAPVQAALTAAARRGVSVQALTNSHSDKYAAWRELNRTLGANSSATNFATTCWQGCLTARPGPVPGGPTAWYHADATTLTSRTVVFSDQSIRGTQPIVRWRWDFGDGTRAEGPGPHTKTYAADGTYKTSLTVTDAAGVTHTTRGDRTLPDNLEPMYPSLHSKLYLFSTVGTGRQSRQWISAYSSGNPTYQQARKGFNNLNVAVGDRTLYTIFRNYFNDLVRASRGQLFSSNYFRTLTTPGNAATGARPTTVHLLPQTSGDINRDILKSIKCRYKVGTKWKRTDVRVSMLVMTRRGVAGDLWRLAMQQGCNVEIVYTQMSQRLKGANGRWLADEDGGPTDWGVADCLSTPPTKVVLTKARKGKPAKRKVVRNSVGDCSGGSLRGGVPVTSNGTWLNRTSPYGGGRLIVRMSCPVAPKYDPVRKSWAVACIRADVYTHHKLLMVNGHIHGKPQKYVMTGTSNWSRSSLRLSDELITEIQHAGALYDQYRSNHEYIKKVVAKNSLKKGKKATVYRLQLSQSQVLDVRGLTDEQLAADEG